MTFNWPHPASRSGFARKRGNNTQAGALELKTRRLNADTTKWAINRATTTARRMVYK